MISYSVYISDAAYKDIHQIVSYIADELLEPQIANNLLDPTFRTPIKKRIFSGRN